MRHIVDIEELKDFTFEHVVCASSKEHKKLVIYVNPHGNFLHYRVYLFNNVDCVCLTLGEALDKYNQI